MIFNLNIVWDFFIPKMKTTNFEKMKLGNIVFDKNLLGTSLKLLWILAKNEKTKTKLQVFQNLKLTKIDKKNRPVKTKKCQKINLKQKMKKDC